ncbi:hypothetical protein DT076_04640 [Desertihabitans brevis]|uniref:Pyrrolo-quinoline quinone repeat domain-containing protein n=1 Tax=Desertihabitans brevis TaxID=2268447 RepID=A0A367YYW6_9ACTN|nr:hypothetical protein DT076_04640 [Desertihabitans brevis]
MGTGILLLVLALLSVAAMARPRGFEHAAARLVAVDGGYATMAAADGSRLDVETAHQTGAGALTSAPEAFLSGALALGWELSDQRWVRQSERHEEDGRTAATHRLQTVTEAGLETWVEVSPAGDRVFSPPLPTLVADVAPGSRWSAEGTVSDGSGADIGSYRVDLAAEDADEAGCLDVRQELVVAGRAETGVDTWCPGRGVVARERDGRRWTPAAAPGPSAGLGTANPAPRWEPGRWRAEERPLLRHGTEAVLTSAQPPVAGSDPERLVLALDAAGDLVALDTATPGSPVLWYAHPGGVLTAVRTFGQVTVAATTTRELVAYDDRGRRLWTHRLDDVSQAGPLALDATTLVVADLSGTVTALDVATGAERWRAALDSDLTGTPVVCGDVVVAADAVPGLHAFDAATGAERWRWTPPEPVQTVGCDAGLVVLTDLEGDRHGIDAGDGTTRWRVAGPSTVRTVAVVSGLVVLGTADGVEALDAATGESRWSQPEAPLTLLEAGGHLVLARPAGLDVLTPDGQRVAEVPVDLAGLGGSARLSAVEDGLWVLTAAGTLTRVGP